jgi:hypothetical protein
MKPLLLAFALYAAFHAGRAYGDEPAGPWAEACAAETRETFESQCQAYPADLDFGGMTQCELAGLWTSGDPFIGWDDEIGCFTID